MKKRSGIWIASKLALHLPGPFSARFARPDGAAVRACRICCVVALAEDRRFAAAKQAGFTIAPPQRRTFPLVFSAEKTATLTHKILKRQSAELRSAGLRSKLKKGLESAGKLAFTSVPNPFSLNCRVNHAVNFQYQTQVLWYFLDARKYRPPRLLTVQPLQTPRKTRDTSTCRKPLRSRRAQPAAAQDRFPAESEGSCPSRWLRCGKEPRC